MSSPMPVTSANNRKLWRDVFLSDKAHDAENPNACTCFFKTHAQDFSLLCLDELDKIYAIAEAQERLIEALEQELKFTDSVSGAANSYHTAHCSTKKKRAALNALRTEVGHE